MQNLLRHLQKDLELVNGLSLDQVLRKVESFRECPQGAWDHVVEEMSLKFTESGHPIFRSTTPLSRGRLKSEGKGRCPYTSLLIRIQLIQFIALFCLSISSVSTEQ